jgi:prevent-host-death family protein
MQRTVDVTMARRQFGTLLDEVFYRGDIITIERKGKPMAQLIPVENDRFQETQHSDLSPDRRRLLEELHSLPIIATDEDPTEVLRNLRKQKRVQASIKYGK